jgi:hypothetical protein
MEQNNGQEDLVDLSQVLDEGGKNESPMMEENGSWREESSSSEKKVPGLYGLTMKLSGGFIKTEKQVKIVLVVLIILLNVFTFSLLTKGNKTAQQANIPANMQMQMPAAQTAK